MRADIQWHSVRPSGDRWFVRWSGYGFLLIGILALSVCGYVLLEMKVFQAYQSWRFDAAMTSTKQPAPASEEPAPVAAPIPAETVLAPVEDRIVQGPRGVLVGRIEIERIGMAAMIMEGVDSRTLRHAVGHIPGTALPGVAGNVGIAGHRDTFFRKLKDVRPADEITLTTLEGAFRYRVELTQVVEPRDTWVLRDTGEETLTLVTCYPFHFVGTAPQRFIVQARRVTVEEAEAAGRVFR